jgi:cytochrome c oxidase subunit II
LTSAPFATRRRRLLVALATAALTALLLAPTAFADVFTPESGGSPNADKIDSLYKIILYVGIVIFIVVEGALIWALVKYRARKDGPAPQQIHGNTPLELGWTIGAAVILVVLAVVTFIFLPDIQNPPESSPGGLAQGVEVASVDQPNPPGDRHFLTINVNGQQYLWRYDYPGDQLFSYYELVVPIKTTVVLKIRSSDVDHSWWIPKLGGKADAVPGYTNETWFKIEKPGYYKGQCAELCGFGHADMRAVVHAVQPAEYQAFLVRQKKAILASHTALAAQRRAREAAGTQ